MLENASRERDEENGVYHNIIPGAKRACTKAVGFLDGGGAQLVAITDEESLILDELIKLTLRKHSASRSGGEQYLDLSRLFKMMHKKTKTITAIK